MAIIALQNPSGLKMKFDCGKDENNKSITRSKTYSNLRADADNQAVYDVATAIGSLQINALVGVSKLDNTTISE